VSTDQGNFKASGLLLRVDQPTAFVVWLSKKTGKDYGLLSETERE